MVEEHGPGLGFFGVAVGVVFFLVWVCEGVGVGGEGGCVCVCVCVGRRSMCDGGAGLLAVAGLRCWGGLCVLGVL